MSKASEFKNAFNVNEQEEGDVEGSKKKMLSDLDPLEKKISLRMKDKGYKFAVQFENDEGMFGAPLYFKSASEVGPFMRKNGLKMVWTLKMA